MYSFSADPAHSHYTTRIHPALTSFADEVCGTLARLCAYVMTLALLAIVGIGLWDQLPDAMAIEPPTQGGWSPDFRAVRAFAVSQANLHNKTEAYEISRHPEGGRKDMFRWRGADSKPVAELEIYRPGGEFQQAGSAVAEIASRMDPHGNRELEAAGVVDSKFGTVTLLRLLGGADTARTCLGFAKRIDDLPLRISGWSCLGDDLPARRAAVGCMLNGLILLNARNDAKLAELFALAEVRRGDCAASGVPALSADWITGTDNARLRGTL